MSASKTPPRKRPSSAGVVPWAAGLFTTCLDVTLSSAGELFVAMSEAMVGDLEVTRVQNRSYALAEGFRHLVREANTWTLFLRYQAQAVRRGAPWARRAVEEFEWLKVLRCELPNEAISDGQPDENKTPSPPPGTNPIEPGNAAPEAGIVRRNPTTLQATDARHIAQVRLGRPQPAQVVEGKVTPSFQRPRHRRLRPAALSDVESENA